jgi:hypothetical protein
MADKIYPLRLYVKHIPNVVLFGVGLALNIAIWVVLLWNIRPQEELIFLHYSILFGVDLIGEWWKVLYVPIGGLVILLLNLFIGWFLFQKDKFANYVLLFIAALCQAFLFVTAMLLIFLNV